MGIILSEVGRTVGMPMGGAGTLSNQPQGNAVGTIESVLGPTTGVIQSDIGGGTIQSTVSPDLIEELVGSTSPNVIGSSMQSSRAVMSYSFNNLITRQVGGGEITSINIFQNSWDTIKRRILGVRKTDSISRHGIITQAPCVHPLEERLFASQIQSLRGVGEFSTKKWSRDLDWTLSRTTPFGPLLTEYAAYEKYLLDVEYTTLPYPVISDASLDVVTPLEAAYINDVGLPVTIKYAQEWRRYCNWTSTLVQNGGNIVLPNGTMKLVQAGDSIPFSGKTNFVLPDIKIAFTWHAVPWSYVSAKTPSYGSFIRGMVGRINQKEWNGWKAGSLRYDNYEVLRKYNDIGTNKLLDDSTTLCDIEFTFVHTNRISPIEFTPTNGNFVGAGHNLLPSGQDLKYYYGYTPNAVANLQRPAFLSAPFELLFTNPLATNYDYADWPQIRA